jgi:hypothetical protein
MEIMIPLRVNLRVDFDQQEHDIEEILENARCEIFLERPDVPVLSAEITDWETPGDYE